MLSDSKARELLRLLDEAARERVPFSEFVHFLGELDAHELEGAEGHHRDAWERHERAARAPRPIMSSRRRTGRARAGAR